MSTSALSVSDPLETTANKLRGLGQGSVRFITENPAIALVILDNPQRHNALSGKMMAELRDIVLQLEEQQYQPEHDERVAVVVSGSAGKSFCAGLDLDFAREHLQSGEAGMALNKLMNDTMARFARLPYITVASVAGPVLGGGTEFITAFDYICMASTAHLRFVQTRMGVTSPWGGARRLVNSIGRKQALKVLGTAPKLDAVTAHAIGLVDVVVNTDKQGSYEACLKASYELLNGFIQDEQTGERVSPGAIRGMKQLVARADLDQDSEFELNLLATVAAKSSKI
ncbi:ClpP/crotonase-like domain-containing protein [Syncephalastrum racemosum]|uniref:ClpP/crotonase-like domain-containing protein n=1 Tax=Syncephalastrum racemosum TaxID=13706 RepID=A0A1X2HFW0_SYNRA|nr:ClpP/crotonase-like domain-containing protein [Syncephalastrum racemosum]